MASPTQWPWVWASSGSWWWTGRPGMLQSMGVTKSRTRLSHWTELSGMQDLSSLTGDWTCDPVGEAQCPNHWTARKVPLHTFSWFLYTALMISDCLSPAQMHSLSFTPPAQPLWYLNLDDWSSWSSKTCTPPMTWVDGVAIHPVTTPDSSHSLYLQPWTNPADLGYKVYLSILSIPQVYEVYLSYISIKLEKYTWSLLCLFFSFMPLTYPGLSSSLLWV